MKIRTRYTLAFLVAVIADFIQLPLIAAFHISALALPAETAILFVDAIAFILITALLRFHWILLPSLAVEAIPYLDAIPTWTGCVAFVVWWRGRIEPTVAEEKRITPESTDGHNLWPPKE